MRRLNSSSITWTFVNQRLFTSLIFTGLYTGCATWCLDNANAIFGFGFATATGFRGFDTEVTGFSLLGVSRIWVVAAGILPIAANHFASHSPHTIGVSGYS
jgi:hypothetical protein